MILVSFTLIFLCKSYSAAVNQKYPAVDCQVIQDSYNTTLQKYAVAEYKANKESGKTLQGTLQCFCEQ